jgi:hypothetical protein
MTTEAQPHLSRPRQLKLPELQRLFPLDFQFKAGTSEVYVPEAWKRDRLVRIDIVAGKRATVHRAAAPIFTEWLRRAQVGGVDVASVILSVDGGFNARLKRGANVPVTEAGLSRHARGTAIDLNASFNRMGTPGAKALGEPGCLLPLVPYAYDLDIVWGGDWKGASCDPMHFEIGTR